jgi:hypothetical protein
MTIVGYKRAALLSNGFHWSANWSNTTLNHWEHNIGLKHESFD